MSGTKKVEYIGPRRFITMPGQPRVVVEQGEVVEVPADMVLGAHWREAKKPSPAPSKDGE